MSDRGPNAERSELYRLVDSLRGERDEARAELATAKALGSRRGW
jgi:hypothetical protein